MPWVVSVLDFIRDYARENLLINPQSEAASIVAQEIEDEIEKAAGFQSNSKIRKVVELHAMRCARVEFEKRGYEIADHSARKPYDLLGKKSDETKYIEVKGAQGDGLDVFLTAGEVKFIEENGANCVLCVVHGISVNGKRIPKASGGQVSLNEPVVLSDGILQPIAFTFRRNK